MSIAKITYHFEPGLYQGWTEDLNTVTDEITEALTRHFISHAEAMEAQKEHKDILAGFIWDFPVETFEQKAVRAQALEAVIAQSEKASAWADFMADATTCAMSAFYALEMGDPAEDFRFDIHFNPGADAGAGAALAKQSKVLARTPVAEAGGLASRYYGGGNERIEAFEGAATAYKAAKRADDVAWLSHNPQQGGSLEALQDAQHAVEAAKSALRAAVIDVSREEAMALGLLAVWREAIGETNGHLVLEEDPLFWPEARYRVWP